MTVSKSPKKKAEKRISRELERYEAGDISFQKFTERVKAIKEYYEI